MKKNPRMEARGPYDLIVIGGGAAGFFGAINVAAKNPSLDILIVEKTNKLLAKVRVSGGGRCNVAHDCVGPGPLSRHYPRGQKALKKLFTRFQAGDVVEWFAQRGVKLKTEGDGRMFPVTDRSGTIVNCFLSEAERLGIQIEIGLEVVSARKGLEGFALETSGHQTLVAKKILVAIGGHARPSRYEWIKGLGHGISRPIPSLFTFNDTARQFADLMGVSVPTAQVHIMGTSFREKGPVLVTHWGLSGPAVIKLSAWAAGYLFDRNYDFVVLVNWTGEAKEGDARACLVGHGQLRPKQKVAGQPLYGLPLRLWARLCKLSGIDEDKIWSGISTKQRNKLVENLVRCPFHIKGKTTFKEEFVTCGGVGLEGLDLATMESRMVKGMYFAGEVLDIDGETGGFNFQAAWTTAYVAACSIADGETKETKAL